MTLLSSFVFFVDIFLRVFSTKYTKQIKKKSKQQRGRLFRQPLDLHKALFLLRQITERNWNVGTESPRDGGKAARDRNIGAETPTDCR